MRSLMVALVATLIIADGVKAAQINSAADLKARLMEIGRSGRTVYSWSTHEQNWTEQGWRQFSDATGHEPLLYFAEFRALGGTWRPREYIEKCRTNFAATTKRLWRERRAVPLVTWHIQNPYVPVMWKHPQYGRDCGMRYMFGSPGYPKEHRNVLREIVSGTGGECGFGRIDGRNEKTFKNPREWFEWVLTDLAAFCKTLVDDEGRRIPIVWRPFHEMDGGWFWWGQGHAEPKDLIAAYRLFIDIMRRELGRENMLVCYSPDRRWKDLGKAGESGFLTWYPGHDYADFIGWDDYGIGAGDTEKDRRENVQKTLDRMRIVTKFAQENDKVCGIWESGNRMFGAKAKDRPGFYRAFHDLATAPGVAFSVMTTYDGPCTFPNSDEGKREMAEFLSSSDVFVDSWDGKKRFANPVDYVDPFIGTKFPGNTYPGPCAPFGLVQPGPDTSLEGMWKCSGYQIADPDIYGFSQNHVSGTGCPVGGDLRIMPFSGVKDVSWDLHARKDDLTERASAGYYRVAFPQMAVTTEITSTKRVGYYRFTFEKGDAHVLVDTQFGLTHTTNSLHRHVTAAQSAADAAKREISGYNVCSAWNKHEYGYVLRFSRPWSAIRKLPRLKDEKADRYVVDFDLKPGETLEAQTALSYVDEAGARRNLAAEGASTFDAVRAATAAEWNKLLKRVELPGVDDARRRTFYTALYHTCVQPNLVTDVDGRYRTGIFTRGKNAKPHGQVGQAKAGREIYSNFSLWDTFRATHPFYTLFAPETTEVFVESMLEQFRINGFLPVIPYLGNDSMCMIANHSIPVVVDAYLKGYRGFDTELAYAAVTNSLTVEHDGKIKEDWRMYEKYGYYPYDLVNGENVSRSMEGAYNDICAARFAAAKGDEKTAKFFEWRASLWTNNFDHAYGLVRGKSAKGEWRDPFDEFFWAAEFKKYDCTEANSWIYTFHVLHDVPALIALFGGRDAFLKKLDQFYSCPVSAVTGKKWSRGRFGGHDQSNEPSHHIPYLYQWAGRGDRTAELVRGITEKLYHSGPQGICGNDDCGQTSAWYLFSSMGFYPVDPCGGEYVIGAPQLPEIRMALPNGKSLHIVAKNLSKENLHVKSVTWNGQQVNGFILRHQDLIQGGELVFEMAPVAVTSSGESIHIECERFENRGGWVVDSQFIGEMGSSYLLAHGLGNPVADAKTSFTVEKGGKYFAWVRTKDWTAKWSGGRGATAQPEYRAAGRFQLVVNGETLAKELGAEGKGEWLWSMAGEVTLKAGENTLALHDLTGFDGRCDAVAFTLNSQPPQSPQPPQPPQPSQPSQPSQSSTLTSDLTVVGGGIAGICTAISAARLGLKVALVQDRPMLGGANSSEVRVHLGGYQNLGPYPRLGDVVSEIGPAKGGNAQPAERYEDDRKLAAVKAEKNITLFLNTRVGSVDANNVRVITSVTGTDVITGKRTRFVSPLFADCTGDGTVGYLAGADYRIGRESRAETGETMAPEVADKMTMGASVQWYAGREAKVEGEGEDFPNEPWMIRFNESNCEYNMRGDWDWETGMNRDQLNDFETVRDYGLLVVYSNWSYIKNFGKRKAEFADAALSWVAYVAGKRETRRLMGDHILCQQDVFEERPYPDGTCCTTWAIDLHYPMPSNQRNYPGEPFRSICTHNAHYAYPIPYRCFYSRNVENLFMAGRDISVTHVALGTTRVMRTHGMQGEVVGMAASICKRHACNPRGVYTDHLDELKLLMTRGIGLGKIQPPQNYNCGSLKRK